MRLRYDSPLLLGEADRAPPGLLPAVLLVGGVACALTGAALLLSIEPPPGLWCGALGLIAAVLVGSASRLDQRARRRRRFGLDFDAHRLRLDFTVPPQGLPRTLELPFDRVRGLQVLTQPNGRSALAVDISPRGDEALVREVLVAEVRPEEAAGLDYLERLLTGAFGLGFVEGQLEGRALSDFRG